MAIFFSKSERTFFDDEINAVLPADAKPISVDDWTVLFAGVAIGKEIDFSGDRPVLVDRSLPTMEQYREMALSQRDQGLSIAAVRIAPLQDAVDLGDATDADTALLRKWKQYRVAVNRITDQAGFPDKIDWPLKPS